MVRKKLLVAVAAAALAWAPTLAMAAEGSSQVGSLSRTGTGQVAQIELPEECEGLKVGDECVHEGVLYVVALVAGVLVLVLVASSGGGGGGKKTTTTTTTATSTATGTATSTAP